MTDVTTLTDPSHELAHNTSAGPTPDDASPGASAVAALTSRGADGLPNANATANGGGNGANKRKRGTPAAAAGTSTSARGVANLTPEQLERKRANDREAQRAIRERTKQQIERLNDRIRELESSQPYRDLQAVIQQKDAVQAENEDIKRQLATFMAVFQRYMGEGPAPAGLDQLAAAAERDALPYPPADQPQLLSQQDPYPPPPAPPDHHSPHAARSVGSPMSSSSMHRPFHHSYDPSQQPNPNRNWIPPPPSTYEHLARNLHPELAYNQSNDERLGVDFLLGENSPAAQQQQSSRRAAHNGMNNGVVSAPSPNNPATNEPPGHYNAIPRRIAATCPLDAILLDAVAERNRARAAGAPPKDVVGPLYPNWNHLLNKNTSTPNHPVSKLIIDICRTFPDLHRLPEQVAVIYIMFLITRWEVEPSRENYERLPEWVRPLPSQLFTPHPCWLDYLPWPRLRDAAVQTKPYPNFDTFFVPYTTTLSLNWPYSPSDVLLPSSGPPHPMTTHPATASTPGSVSSHGGGGGQGPGSPGAGPEPTWRMNPAFETHLRDLGNWSLGVTFRDTFPEWAQVVRIKDEGEGSGSGSGSGRRR